jgi:hypothetical protein
MTNSQAGVTVFVLTCAVSAVLLGRVVRPWLLGGILAAPVASISCFAIEFLLTGHVDKFWPIAFVVVFGFSFVLTIPLSLVGYAWRRRAARKRTGGLDK